jgi:hypothetical protein
MNKRANLKHMWTVGLLLALLVGLCPVLPVAADSGTTDAASTQDAGWWATVEENIRRAEYHVTWQEHTYLADVTTGAYQAPNRAQNLRTYFSAEGLVVIPRVWPEAGETPPWRWELTLTAWGRASTLKAVPAADLQAQDNRIEYQHGGLAEWYVNDENGLEQGFSLAAPPAGTPTGEPLQLDLLIGGDLAGEVVHEGAAVEFRNPGGEDGLRYGSLQAVDAGDRSLPTWLTLTGATLSLFVDDAEAVYPIQIDPSITGLSEDYDWSIIADQSGVDDHLGYSVATAGDVNGDGYSDVLVGMPEYDEGDTDEGGVFLFYGSASGLPTNPSPFPIWQINQDGAHFGESVAAAGDVNGDGYGDVIVGAPYLTDSQSHEGGVWVFLGSSSGLVLPPWSSQSGGQQDAEFGASVATAGDVNRDGYSDVIVGAPFYHNGETDEGRAYVWYGSSDPIFDHVHDWRAEGNQASAQLGSSVATAGDVNGDGYSDIIVGAPGYANPESGEGTAFVWHGAADGLNGGVNGTPANVAWLAQGNQGEAHLGNSVSTAGDVNGDGYADVVVGGFWYTHGEEDEGAAWVFLGSDGGLENDWVSRKESNQPGAHLGQSVATAGDVNGDGYADVIVGAPYYDTPTLWAGRAWVWYGSADGPSSASDWHDDGDWQDAFFGYSVATAGDVNGDGYSDVIVGAPGSIYGTDLWGYVNVYYGGPSTLSDTAGWSRDSNKEGAQFGLSVSTAGDVNGDGYADIIVGAPYWDGGQDDEGKAWLYFGSATGPSETSDWSKESDQAGAHFGRSVSTAGDVNGDGYDDLIIGAPDYTEDYQHAGVAWVYHGSASKPGSLSDWHMSIDSEYAGFGWAVSTAGDVNGDGFADVVIGAPDIGPGLFVVYLGSVDGLGLSSHWGSSGPSGEDCAFGYSVGSAGDVNGDGYSDIIVGDPFRDSPDTNSGSFGIWYGTPSESDPVHTVVSGSNQGECLGYSVASAGDVNGDGYADVIVGAPFYHNGQNEEGIAHVYYGSSTGLIVDTPAWSRESNREWADFGYSVGSAGDVNGDGYADVIIGATGYDVEGSAWVYLGSSNGLPSTSDWHVSGGQDSSHFGASVGTAGDVNGDGYADVIVGAPHYNNPTSSEGMAFLYYGNGSRGVGPRPRQGKTDGGPLSHLGMSDSENGLILWLHSTNPFGRSGLRFEAEVKPLGESFDGNDTCQWADYIHEFPGSGHGSYCGGLTAGTVSHWRARWRYDPVTTPWMPASRWVTMPWNGWNEADFRTLGQPRVFLPLVLRNYD